jgi:hypothetical protein
MVRKTKEMNMESLMEAIKIAKLGRFCAKCGIETNVSVQGHIYQLNTCLCVAPSHLTVLSIHA